MKNRTNTRWLTQLALLVAVLLVMNYTPLGYLQVGPLSMSLLTIPVAIGAMTLGPVAGAILGGVFGTTSFVSALQHPQCDERRLLQASPGGHLYYLPLWPRSGGALRRLGVYWHQKAAAQKHQAVLRRGRCGNAAAEHLLVHAFAVRVLF